MIRAMVFVVVVFAMLPYPAQLAVLALVRSVPGEVWLGFIGASLAAPMWITIGLNAMAYQIYQEDVSKAEDAFRRRKR